jgi:hypothetical protein
MTATPPPGFDPSSFAALISGLGAQAKIFLGAMKNPLTNQEEAVDLEKAKVFINTLTMLQEKTKGNLAPEEDNFLRTILTDLQMGFVNQSGSSAEKSAGA